MSLGTETVTTTPDAGAATADKKIETTSSTPAANTNVTATPAATAEAAKAVTKTSAATGEELLGDGDDADDGADAKGAWPEDWRARLAGGDEKFAKQLERFASPDTFSKSYKALQQKLSSGEYKATLPENATEEQIAEYRKSNGIPETPDAYSLDAVPGVEWQDTDKAVLGEFTAALHRENAPQPVVDAILKTYAKVAQQNEEARVENDKHWKQTNEDQLRNELGSEFRSQIGIYNRIMHDPEVFPGGLVSVLGGARDAQGNRLINDARVAQFFIQAGLDRYGDGALAMGTSGKTMASEEESLTKLMRENFTEYVRQNGPNRLAEIRAKKRG